MVIFENFVGLFSTPQGIIGQCFGFAGLIIMVLSFQCKKNRTLFIMQSVAAFCYVLNFLLVGSWTGTLFNLCGLIRGFLFMSNSEKKWKLILTESLFVGSYAVSLVLDHRPVQIILASLVLIGLLSSTYFMWRGETKNIRICQIACTSPVWIAHNFYNPSLPGIICECFNMVSSAIFLVRLKKSENKE